MKTKKRFRGMTLFEIVVAIAIYGIIAMMLVEIMSNINSTMRITNNLNKRLSYEAKYADNRLTTADANGKVVNLDKSGNTVLSIEFSKGSGSGAGTHTVDASGKTYEVQYRPDEDVDGSNTNYRFMVFTLKKDDSYHPYEKPYAIPLGLERVPYPIVCINVYAVDETKTPPERGALIATTNADTDDPTFYINYPEFEMESGKYKRKSGTDEVVSKMIRVPRVYQVPSTKDRLIFVERNTEAAAHGYKTVEIELLGDLSSELGPTEVQVKKSGTDKSYSSKKYPFFSFTLNFCAFTKDAAGELASWFDDPGVKYDIKNTLEVDPTDYSVSFEPASASLDDETEPEEE